VNEELDCQYAARSGGYLRINGDANNENDNISPHNIYRNWNTY